MAPSALSFLSLSFIFLFSHVTAQTPPTNITTSFSCSCDSSLSCNTYVGYRAQAPDFLDVGAISDLFGVSRLRIKIASNLPFEDVKLSPGQLLLVPVPCGCTKNISAANITYQIKGGDSFYALSVHSLENLTEYHVVEAMNPNLNPFLLQVGTQVALPIFCKCPTSTQLAKRIEYLISYVWQEKDNVSEVGRIFNASVAEIEAANNYRNFSVAVGFPVLVPVSKLPVLSQPVYSSEKSESRRIFIILISIIAGLVFVGIGCLLVFIYCKCWRTEKTHLPKSKIEAINLFKIKKATEENPSPRAIQCKLLPGVSGYLNKPTVYEIKTIMEATMDLSERFRIGRTVYRALINDNYYAVKQTRGDVTEKLAILQKVNHANLVKLNGISIDGDGSCFLIYEFAENGSLDKWLYPKSTASSSSSLMFLSWRQRLKIALDVANGLQYMHEHTRPIVVHRDIRTSNILLSSQFKAKISNFSRTTAATDTATPKVDVHAFGIILLELLSGRKSMQIREGGEVVMLWQEVREILESEEKKEEKMKKLMDPNLEGFYPVEGALTLASMARACTMEKPSARPSMGEIVFGISVLTQSSMETMDQRSWTDGLTEESHENIMPVVAR
ncbi:serine/threonine receptor-like kinase NFP [Aristolochia californica]|uniref:serine/threonine receptor-like kinase NFP n=1 Tax=Aristolochia californica TaxID=171875 RepID=UPI0035DFF573